MSPLLRQVIDAHRSVLWLLLGALGAGVAACGVAAGVASFLWLTTLAVAAGWAVAPWLLPLCVDALAWSGLLLWMLVRSWYALGVAIGALAASVAGNVAAHLTGTPLLQVDPWVAGVVAAVPPVALGLIVHLVPLFLGSLAWLAETSTPPAATERERSSDGSAPPPVPRESSPGSGSTSGASGSRTTRRRPTAVPAAGSVSIETLALRLRGRPDLAGMSERALRSLVNGELGLSASTERIKAARDLALASPNGETADVAGQG